MTIPHDPETGERLKKTTVFHSPDEIVVKIAPKGQARNSEHVRVRTARDQGRMYGRLTLAECGFIFKLLPYLEWETNIVCGDGVIEEKGKPLNFTKIEAVTGISRPTRIDILASLVEKKVFGYLVVANKRVALVLNPKYALRGRSPDDALRKAFETHGHLEE